jgi:uridine phosphorylase
MSHATLTNANFPVDGEGHTYHVGVKRGEVANRIITVGDPERAIGMAAYLDGGEVIQQGSYKQYLNYKDDNLFIFTSPRLFTTVTGRYRGTPLSIIAIGMVCPFQYVRTPVPTHLDLCRAFP